MVPSTRVLGLLTAALVVISLLLAMPLASLASARVEARAGDVIAIAGDDDCNAQTNDQTQNGDQSTNGQTQGGGQNTGNQTQNGDNNGDQTQNNTQDNGSQTQNGDSNNQ